MQEQDEGDVPGDEPDTKCIPRPTSWAWGLCWLMFASTVLNYMDRQTITLVKHQISETFAIRASPISAGFSRHSV